jgi:hypothetical protein
MPRLQYKSRVMHRHRDCKGRIWIGPEDDRYLHPHDGRLAELVVQTTDELLRCSANSTWRRTSIRNVTPLMLRIVCWTMSTVSMNPDQIGEKGRSDEESSLNPARVDRRDSRSRLKEDDWGEVCVKWLPACLAIFVLVGSYLLPIAVSAFLWACLTCCSCSFPQT